MTLAMQPASSATRYSLLADGAGTFSRCLLKKKGGCTRAAPGFPDRRAPASFRIPVARTSLCSPLAWYNPERGTRQGQQRRVNTAAG